MGWGVPKGAPRGGHLETQQEGRSLGLSGGRRWHLGAERGKMWEGSAPGATKEMRAESVGCSRGGQRGCEGVLPLLEGMKSLALSLQ